MSSLCLICAVVSCADDSVKKVENFYTQKLLDVLGNDTLSAAEITKRFGRSHRPTVSKNYLNLALAQQGVIEMTIPDKPKSRYQQYRKRLSR